MEMDLAPFFGNVFNIVLFSYNAILGSIGIFVWLHNKKNWAQKGSSRVLVQALARCWLDIGLVAGILLTAMGAMGLVYYGVADLEYLYAVMPILLGTFLWGGIITGLGYCLFDKDLKIDYTLSRVHLMIGILLIAFIFVEQAKATRIPLLEFFTNTEALYCFLGLFVMIALFSLRNEKPAVVVLADANLVATLGGMAMGISFWFIEGADYDASRDAIYLIANILMYGSLSYLMIYLCSLLTNTASYCNYQTKSWHFAEASAFFIFLVYAPVGTTEYLRESNDQAAIQDQHEAQELRIEQLEAQIKLLTEKVGEV